MLRFVGATLFLAAVFWGHAVYEDLTSPLLNAQTIADRVGGLYGDGHPQVVKVDSTDSDGLMQDPMYILTVQGHFEHQGRTARYLTFSALRNRWYVWALWASESPPGPGAHRSWMVDSVPIRTG